MICLDETIIFVQIIELGSYLCDFGYLHLNDAVEKLANQTCF